MKCIGYDVVGGTFDCPNEAGTPWTPVWCLSCDELRRARITDQLDELAQILRDRAKT